MIEWQDHYLAYSQLKAAVYKAEKEALQYRLSQEHTDEEQGGLLANEEGAEDRTSPEGMATPFKALCDAELDKMNQFYASKEGELLDSLGTVKDEIQQVEEEGAFGDIEEDSEDESGESGDDDGGILKRSSKLIKSVVTGGGLGSSAAPRKREGSGEEERFYGDPSGSARRRSSSLSRTHARKRSNTGSEGSSNDALAKVNSRDGLPPETATEIDNQINRTMQAVTSSSSSDVQHHPTEAAGTSKRRQRASSFGASGPSLNDIWTSHSRHAVDMRITFKLRIQALFRDLSQLKEYISLNQSEHWRLLERSAQVVG